MKRITFDVDNVLADSISCWCGKASSFLGYTVSKEDIISHKIVGSLQMQTKDIFRLQDEVWQEWTKLPLTEIDIPKTLQDLKNRGFKVFIATSRPLRSVAFVRKWIEKMGIPHDAFYPLGPFRAKVELDSDVLVDDAPDQIMKFVEKARLGILYEQPWNRLVTIPKAITIRSVAEIFDYL